MLKPVYLLLIPALMSSMAFAEASGEQSCGLKKIADAAVKISSSRYGNQPQTRGVSPQALRQALAEVGIKDYARGNAIDMIKALKDAGFVEAQQKDVHSAPAGAIVIVKGPQSDQYLKAKQSGQSFSGNFHDYIGDLAVKGVDGHFYADGKRLNMAMGWENDHDVTGQRRLGVILVPGPKALAKIQGCGAIQAAGTVPTPAGPEETGSQR